MPGIHNLAYSERKGRTQVNEVVAVVGKGQLAEFVCERLSYPYKIAHQVDLKSGVPKTAELVLVVDDDWRVSDYETAEQVLQRGGIPWLSSFILYDEAIVGPLVRPGIPGCSQCADMRRLMAGNNSENTLKLQMDLLMHGAVSRDSSASRLGILHTSCFIVEEAHRILHGGRALSEGKQYIVDLTTLRTSLHAFLPNPRCQVCGGLPDDSPDLAQISIKPSPKINSETYRCRPLDDLEQVMFIDYLDNRTGLFNEKTVDLWSPFADVSVNLPSNMGNDTAAGRSHTFAVSERTAILEGLERYCGMFARGKRTVINESYRNLSDRALNPFDVGVYSAEQYAQPDFPFQPFDPNRPISWVWGYSLLQERPILVPEQLAYYNMGGGRSFVNEGSNGCALGGTLEEAILYGILEVVERDSLLMTWYARMPVPRLDPFSADNKELELMVHRVQAVAGYEVLLCNITMENGIPSIWAALRNKKESGARLICSAGSHLDPIRAAKSAIFEAAGHTAFLDEMFKENKDEYIRMLEDPLLVSRMEDHSLLYTVPEAEQHLQFLLDADRPLRTFEEEFKPRARHADLTEDLKDVLKEFQRLNLNVIIIDQTAREISRNGLHCVKVLIPGMLPMSFGHHLVRLTGLDRVFRVPMELGYANRRLTPDDINPFPHPFI